MNWTTLRKAIYDWVSSVDTTSTVIWARQNAPFPALPVMLMRLYSVASIAMDFIAQKTNDDGKIKITGNREFFCELQAYGGDAIGRVEDLRMSLQTDTVKAALIKAGLVYVTTEPILDISGLNPPQMEDRATMDVRFRVAHEFIDTPGFIDTVRLTSTYKDIDDSIIMVDTSTITVNP